MHAIIVLSKTRTLSAWTQSCL